MTKKITLAGWAIVFSYASLFVFGLGDNIRGTLFPEILNYFSLTSYHGAYLFAVTSGAAFLGNYGSHYFLKKWTLSHLLFVAVLFMASGMAIIGIAEHYDMMLFGAFIFGLSVGMLAIAQNLLVSENVSSERRPQALAGLHSMYGLSSFMAPVLAAQAALYFNSWRAAFFVVAILSLGFILVQSFIRPEKDFTVTQVEDLPSELQNQKISFGALMVVGGVFAPYVVAEILIGTRLAQYMRHDYGVSLAESSQYVTYYYLGLLIGRLLFALFKVKGSLKTQMNLSLVFSMIFIVLGLKVHPLFLSAVGLSMAPYYPLSVSYITGVTGAFSRKFFTFAMSLQSLCVVSMHIGVGYMTDKVGLFYAFSVGIFALALSAACLNLHPKKLY